MSLTFATIEGGSRLDAAILDRLALRARQLGRGRLLVRMPDGQFVSLSGNAPGPQAEIVIRDRRFLRTSRISDPNLLADAYLDGDWDSSDLGSLFQYFLANRDWIEPARSPIWVTAQLLARWMSPNTQAARRRRVSFHYDLGNTFFKRWLDPSLTYSGAIFEGSDDLQAAQSRKNKIMAERIGLLPGHRVLELGCGWGGFAQFAAQEYGADITAITLSRAQYDHARTQPFDSATKRPDFKLADYREVSGTYDRIVSIEMIEAIGEANWEDYFRRLRALLKPDGMIGLQAILIEDAAFERYRKQPDFIQRHVFPGGMLPSPAALDRAITAAGLIWVASARYGKHYARTLELWSARFEAAWPDLRRLGFDDRFRRLWCYYLSYSKAGFDAGTIDLWQISLAHKSINAKK